MFSFPFSTKGLTMRNSADGTRRGGRMPLNMEGQRHKKPIQMLKPNLRKPPTTRFVFGHVYMHVIARFLRV